MKYCTINYNYLISVFNENLTDIIIKVISALFSVKTFLIKLQQ